MIPIMWPLLASVLAEGSVREATRATDNVLILVMIVGSLFHPFSYLVGTGRILSHGIYHSPHDLIVQLILPSLIASNWTR